jgi:anti-sigma factor RsiW
MDGTGIRAAYSGLQRHITPDLLESYVFGQLSPTDGDHIEAHLAVCEECRHYIIHAKGSTSLAARDPRKIAGIIAAHQTADGTVLLMLRRHSERWVARLRGSSIDGGSFVEDRSAAVAWCHETFQTMFPEHRCTGECHVFVKPASAATKDFT